MCQFNDLGKIGLVLGKDFIVEKSIVDQEWRTDVFANFEHPYASEFAEKRIYQLQPIEEMNEGPFIRIYDPKYSD